MLKLNIVVFLVNEFLFFISEVQIMIHMYASNRLLKTRTKTVIISVYFLDLDKINTFLNVNVCH